MERRMKKFLGRGALSGGLVVFCVFSIFGSQACSPRRTMPMVVGLTTTLGSHAGSVTTEVTLRRSEILNREFLYGADLQYSSVGDAEYELFRR